MSKKTIKNIPSKQIKSKQQKPLIEKKTSDNIPKWAPIAVLVFTAIIYFKVLYNGFTIGWDDDIYITNNPFIRDFSINGIKSIFTVFQTSGNYHPLTTLTDLFIYALFKLNPTPYHILNLLLHLLNTWLVFKLTEHLSGKKITALAVSLLFAVHPMHVESVAWISELKDVLYSLFYLLSLLAYMNYIKYRFKTKYYICAIFLFLFSLLSKSAAVTLPILLIAIDIYQKRKINSKLLLEKVPFLLLSIIFGMINISAQQNVSAISGLSFLYSFIDRIFLFAYTIAFYIVKMIAPFGLSAMHYYPNNIGGTLPWQYYASLPFLLLIIWLFFKRSLFQKEIVFGILFFLITISVMLQVVSVGMSITAERYTYIPYIGLLYIAGQWFSNTLNRQYGRNEKQVKPAYRIWKPAVIALFSLFVIMFSYQTWARISVWKDSEVLFTDVIKKNPDYFYSYWMRGNIKRSKEDFKGALQDFDKTITLDSKFAEAYNDRGAANDILGNTQSALNDYNKAILLKPELADAYSNRGGIYVKLGNSKSAMNDFNKAISLNHQFAEVYCNRGGLKVSQNDFKGAIEDFDYSLKLKPSNKRIYYIAYYLRGISCINLNDTIGACQDWGKAVSMGNEDAAKLSRQYCH